MKDRETNIKNRKALRSYIISFAKTLIVEDLRFSLRVTFGVILANIILKFILPIIK